MSSILQAGKTCDPNEVLTLLVANINSDEGFDESNPIIIKQENSSQDDEN